MIVIYIYENKYKVVFPIALVALRYYQVLPDRKANSENFAFEYFQEICVERRLSGSVSTYLSK